MLLVWAWRFVAIAATYGLRIRYNFSQIRVHPAERCCMLDVSVEQDRLIPLDETDGRLTRKDVRGSVRKQEKCAYKTEVYKTKKTARWKGEYGKNCTYLC